MAEKKDKNITDFTFFLGELVAYRVIFFFLVILVLNMMKFVTILLQFKQAKSMIKVLYCKIVANKLNCR